MRSRTGTSKRSLEIHRAHGARWHVARKLKLSRGYVLGLLGLSILLGEVTLRLAAVFPLESALYVNDPVIGYRLRGGVELRRGETTNARGFNDVERSAVGAEGLTRVAVVGDSFVFGFVPRRAGLTAQLERVANASGAGVEVLNMGVPSADPDVYAGLVTGDCVRMNVDVVCVVFFVGNDITQSHPDFRTRLWLGAPHEVLASPFHIGTSWEFSYLHRTIRAARRMITQRVARPAGASFTEATFLSIEHQRLGIYSRDPSRFVRRCFPEAIASIRRLADAAKRGGMAVVILLAPDQLQIDPGLRSRLAARYGLDLDRLDLGRPQRILTEALSDSDIDVIDLLPALRAQHDPSYPLYLERNTHWNERGNLVVAREAWSALAHRMGRSPDRARSEAIGE